MEPQARRILHAFATRGLQAGDLIRYPEFGDALPLEDGVLRDEAALGALHDLLDGGYVEQASMGLVLTEKGHRFLQTPEAAAEEAPPAAPALDPLLNALLQLPDQQAATHTTRDLAAALTVEAAGLQDALLWKSDEEVERLLADPQARGRIDKGIADVLIYALLFCDRVGVDPLAAIHRKLETGAAS